MKTRRDVMSLLAGGAAVSWPLAARGQAARKRPLVGWLGGSSQHEQVAMRNRDAFVQGLRDHGYEDGRKMITTLLRDSAAWQPRSA